MTADAPDDDYTEFVEALRKLLEEAFRKGENTAPGFSIAFSGQWFPEGPADRRESCNPSPLTEPDTEVNESPDTRYITAELPGIDPCDIRFAVGSTVLHLSADAQERRFRKTIPLEGVDPDTLRYTFRNGILEFSLRKKTGPGNAPQNP